MRRSTRCWWRRCVRSLCLSLLSSSVWTSLKQPTSSAASSSTSVIWFFFFYEIRSRLTISFLLSPFYFFLLLACFVIKKGYFVSFFLALLPTFLLNRLKFTFLQAGVHRLPVRPGIYHTCSTFLCLLCAFCFVTLGFPCRRAICVWHHSGSWLQHPRESKGVYSAISQEAPWLPRTAHVHLLLSR